VRRSLIDQLARHLYSGHGRKPHGAVSPLQAHLPILPALMDFASDMYIRLQCLEGNATVGRGRKPHALLSLPSMGLLAKGNVSGFQPLMTLPFLTDPLNYIHTSIYCSSPLLNVMIDIDRKCDTPYPCLVQFNQIISCFFRNFENLEFS
jgi:hypothetical protein